MPNIPERDRPVQVEEIEVTEEMLKVGVFAYASYYADLQPHGSGGDLAMVERKMVAEVFRAMRGKEVDIYRLRH